MGTTANILFIKDNFLYSANVGDSMTVIYKNGRAIKLNQQHRIESQMELERIKKSGANIVNNRVNGKINLTRAIGK